MPGGSSTVKEEPTKTSSPPPLLGAAGGTEGSTSLCPPTNGHTPLDGLHDRSHCPPANSQGSPTRNASGERVHSQENQAENCVSERLGYGTSCEDSTGHTSEITLGVRHDQAGQQILHATAAPVNELRRAHLCTTPYLVGRPTRESGMRTV